MSLIKKYKLKIVPLNRNNPWYKTKWAIELFSSFPPIIIAAVASFKYHDEPNGGALSFFSALAVVWLTGASILKVTAAREQEEKLSNQYDGILGALHVLHSTITLACNLNPETSKESLRVTFHAVCAPLDSPKKLEQVVNYVGRKGGGAGRSFSATGGVIGMAVLQNQGHGREDAFFGNRENDDLESFKNELEAAWGFSADEIANLSMDSYCWAAIPIKDHAGQHVAGVIYLDSTDKGLLADSAAISDIVHACAGLSVYIHGRY